MVFFISKQGLVSTYTVAQFKSHSKDYNESTQKNELNKAFNQDEGRGVTEEALCNGSGGTAPSLAKWNDYFPSVHHTDRLGTWGFSQCELLVGRFKTLSYLRVTRNF